MASLTTPFDYTAVLSAALLLNCAYALKNQKLVDEDAIPWHLPAQKKLRTRLKQRLLHPQRPKERYIKSN